MHDIHRMEALFTLKVTANANLSQEVVDEILAFIEDIHKSKLGYIKHQLTGKFGGENSVKVKTGIMIDFWIMNSLLRF